MPAPAASSKLVTANVRKFAIKLRHCILGASVSKVEWLNRVRRALQNAAAGAASAREGPPR